MRAAAEPDLIEQGSALARSGASSLLWWGLVALIFAAGLAVRLYNLGAPPLDYHATRQLHSALIARGMYYAGQAGAPAELRKMAVRQWHAEGVIEPQVSERLAAWTYTLIGRVDLRAPRLYAVLFWLVAAFFLTWLALDITGAVGALAAALFMLAWPYGVIASRAFMPEPLILALTAAALWAAVRWHARGGWGWAITAGLLCGLAVYSKAVAVFFIGPALIVLLVSRRGWRRLTHDRQAWLLAGLAAAPYAAYHILGVYIDGFLAGQFSLRFFPQMWTDPAFYLRWISNLGRAIPFELALLALLAALLLTHPAHRAVLIAMWIGYFALGMTLPHHISTHDYYHLPLFLPVGLGLGAAAETIYRHLRGPRWLVRAASAGVLAGLLLINAYEARTAIKRSDAAAQAGVWESVGQVLPPGASVAALVPDYGAGLEYWAWIMPEIWPTADDIRFQQSAGQPFDFADSFQKISSRKDYFLVSPVDDLKNQPELQKALSGYPVLKESPGLIIYDLRSSKSAQ